MILTTEFEKRAGEIFEESPMLYDPLIIKKVMWENTNQGRDSLADAFMTLQWKNKKLNFLVEIKNRTAPSIIKSAIGLLESVRLKKKGYPMLLVPYLNDNIIEQLKAKEISGIDLNGNYLILTEDLLAIRNDKKNNYKESAYIKKIFIGKSSVVGRLFFEKEASYVRVNDIFETIKSLGVEISISTVSKVLTVLEEEFLISRANKIIKVLQPAKLLKELSEKYETPAIVNSLKLKLPEQQEDIIDMLNSNLGSGNWIFSGESSVNKYAVTTKTNRYKIYTKNVFKRYRALKAFEEKRFYNCELSEVSNDFVFFNRQGCWASKLQCYIELNQLDKREKEIASEIKNDILSKFDEPRNG